MSHFIICSYSGKILGMPKGHARTQFEQPIHRGFNEDWTMPSSPFLIASAGHTMAQVGSSQCQQTYAALAVVPCRSMKSKLIIDLPRWVSHSAQASTQDWQPMQREGSTYNS